MTLAKTPTQLSNLSQSYSDALTSSPVTSPAGQILPFVRPPPSVETVSTSDALDETT